MDTNRIKTVRAVAEYDNDPDLSWLDQTDDQMGEGFEADANDRKESFGQSWDMIGILAVAEVVVNGTVQTITSPGLWGIESDSGRAYLKEVQTEELQTLADILTHLGFPVTEIARAIDEADTTY
jgi:hypothetical protein